MSDVMRQTYRPLSEVESLQLLSIKAQAQRLYDMLGDYHRPSDTVTPWASREASLARTKIEEAVMWASKHLTR